LVGIFVDFGLFEEIDEEVYSVFGDKSMLSLSYVPKVLVSRDVEKKYFARILTSGVRENFLPPMVRVFGGAGVGKTVVVKSVMEMFARYQGDVFRWFYVNMKRCRTVFSAANTVLSAICGRRVPVNLGLDRVFTEIWREIKSLKMGRDRLFICLVLDEVDSIFVDKHYDPSDFFYRFLRHQMYLEDLDIKLCLVTITNSVRGLEDNLDGRVKSSMGSEKIMFPSYTKKELEAVLISRLKEAFKPGVVQESVVWSIASRVKGDARKAVDLLRVSGEVANERKSKVVLECLHVAVERVERDWIQEILKDLDIPSKEVLGCIAYLSVGKAKTSTREVYDLYKKTPNKMFEDIMKSLQPPKLGERRVLELVGNLDLVGLISTWNLSRGRKGYTKEIKLNADPQRVLDLLDIGLMFPART
jgi:cell division control protein 6